MPNSRTLPPIEPEKTPRRAAGPAEEDHFGNFASRSTRKLTAAEQKKMDEFDAAKRRGDTATVNRMINKMVKKKQQIDRATIDRHLPVEHATTIAPKK